MDYTVIQTDLLFTCIKHEFPHQNSTHRKLTIADEGQHILYRVKAFEQKWPLIGCTCVDMGLRFFGLMHWIPTANIEGLLQSVFCWQKSVVCSLFTIRLRIFTLRKMWLQTDFYIRRRIQLCIWTIFSNTSFIVLLNVILIK